MIMGLCYQTSRWLDRLWGEHLEISAPARQLVEAGIKKQGDFFAGFPADLHARLYLPADPPLSDKGLDWASTLHFQASELGEWQRLRSMCSRNGFAAGVATEAMLSHLLPHVPEQPPDEGNTGASSSDSTGNSDPRIDFPANPAPSPLPGDQSDSDAEIRAFLRGAAREASKAVQEAEAGMEGMETSLGISTPGTSIIKNSGLGNLKTIREVHQKLSTSNRLKKITRLAGRLERIAASKARSRVKPGVGEVHGIDLGNDLSRLLPAELATLRHPRLRLHLLSRLLQRQALTYGMKGKEPQGKGPIVVLLDESGSMRADDKDIWSKAVCLALLSTATRQKRAWHLVAFNGAIIREVSIPAGQATLHLIEQALDHRCSGGTDFDAPVLRAVEIIKSSRTMKQADVVIITDGEDELEPDTVEAAENLTHTEGVSWFTVGVGSNAETELQSLAPIATSMVRIRDTDDAEAVVPVINLTHQ